VPTEKEAPRPAATVNRWLAALELAEPMRYDASLSLARENRQSARLDRTATLKYSDGPLCH
jgi:hypothetical protein